MVIFIYFLQEVNPILYNQDKRYIHTSNHHNHWAGLYGQSVEGWYVLVFLSNDSWWEKDGCKVHILEVKKKNNTNVSDDVNDNDSEKDGGKISAEVPNICLF